MENIRGGPMVGRTVLFTGASSGVGRATAQRLVTMGAHVAITGRDRLRTDDAAREIGAAGGMKVEVSVVDLPSQALVRRLASEVRASLLRIDVLVKAGAEYPALVQRPTKSSTRSNDQAVAARLWEASADLVRLTAAPRV